MSTGAIRVLVVDDTVIYRRAVSDVLAAEPGIEVVGAAPNGKIALQKIEQLKPDVLTLDIEMPEVDGLEVLRRLRAAKSQVGAVMLSAFTDTGAKSTMAALELGAFDFVLKPVGGGPAESAEALRKTLCPKIKAFGRTQGVQRILAGKTAATSPSQSAPSAPTPRPARDSVSKRLTALANGGGGQPRIVVLGISTGGPQALAAMMPKLPADLGVPLLIVQHMPPKFTKSLAESLDGKCALTVMEAEDGQHVEPGLALIAPGGQQMKVKKSGADLRVCITDDPPENSCKPSVDYLFRSVAAQYGPDALGVIMTGMGSDGALGCRLMARKGAVIMAQDEASCVVYGMPKAVVESDLADVVAPLDGIAGEIARTVMQGVPACR